MIKPKGTEQQKDVSVDMETEISPTDGKKLPQYIAAVIVNLAAFSNGSVIGWTSPMLPVLQSNDTPLEEGPISNEAGSWLGSLMCLGALLATPLYLYISHRYSRKFTGYLIAVPFIVSWIMIITCKSTTVLYIARFIGGMGSGAITVFSTLYISEIAEDNVRGALGSYLILFANAGTLFSFALGSYVSYYTFAYVATLVPILYLLGFIWLPETPTFLVTRGKYTEAKRSLEWLRGRNEHLVDHELNKLISFVKERNTMAETVSFKDMMMSRGTRRAFIIGIVLVANLQFCGIFAILSYTVNIFQEAGSDMSPNASTILIGVLQFFGSCASALLLDKAGRKILLLVSNVCMAICLAAIGGYFFFKCEEYDVSRFGWLPVTCLSAYIIAIALGLAPITFVMISEIFEPQVKGRATTIIVSIMWFLTFVIGKFYTNLSYVLGVHGCYWLFSACCILGTVFAIFEIPETKNRSFESILLELSKGNVVKKRTTSQNEMESFDN
ncbi:facilitated trehalose transporter Tret1-2 homolog [Periplaneta americana]|uniref:facilitated trehalose transporter Tret1-2 homolog n=1 Tax=Periplaneta americana TaxID=6978 RepID=UPI0037E73700